ncbi:MAG: GatB/YqeY domain-containing protein [Lachnospiraceae bacterium]|nr:GatB/YqeY domain-containing protein [Lachnospiraceae bacterium]MBP5532704.1 GatB/YqeY domain-containing protein [Lachnospiraceae bacterium]
MQFTTLQKDMMQAMKDHDKVKKDALSALVSATKKLAIDSGCRDDIPDSMTDQAILKEIKTIKEQIDTCPDSRMELKEEYKARLAVFEAYAPKMLSEAEVEAVIKEKFADVLASGNKGMVMKAVMAELKGKADGKVINQVVGKLTS